MRQTAAAFTAVVLLCYPCPSWSQDSTATLIAICDQAAAIPLDQSRPTGVVGVETAKIDPKIAIPACDAAAKAAPNDPRVAFQLGRAYLAAKDYESARAHLKFAADQGDAGGQNGLGILYATGRGGLGKDEREAARLYKLAADQGNAGGQVNLGSFYATGRGGLTKDDREAARLYKLAADQGNLGGQIGLGTFYATGRGGLTKDDREAARLYKLAADQGNAGGQAGLAFFYETGRGGLAKDEREAARLYKLAADQGNAGGQNGLGVFYQRGSGGLEKDDREAARLYKLAVDQGYAYGQHNLGFFYETGRGGLAKDEREAARLYKLAADQGDAAGQNSLGRFYASGRGGLEKDDREAARLFKLAADQGDAPGQANLGDMYRVGRGGLAKDDREAARLYKLAAGQGDEYAQAALKRLGGAATGTSVDVALVVCGVLGATRGLIRQLISIGCCLVGFVCGVLLYILVGKVTSFNSDASGAALFLAWLVISLVLLVLAARTVHSMLQTRISSIDRAFGLLLGLVRGLGVVVGPLILLFWAFPADTLPDVVRNALSFPLLNRIFSEAASDFLSQSGLFDLARPAQDHEISISHFFFWLAVPLVAVPSALVDLVAAATRRRRLLRLK